MPTICLWDGRRHQQIISFTRESARSPAFSRTSPSHVSSSESGGCRSMFSLVRIWTRSDRQPASSPAAIKLPLLISSLLVSTTCLGLASVLPKITVTNTLDTGTGSLPEPISSAFSGDTIVFAPALAGKTILPASQRAILKSLSINNRPGTTIDPSPTDENNWIDSSFFSHFCTNLGITKGGFKRPAQSGVVR
jgi:hypothetical protein